MSCLQDVSKLRTKTRIFGVDPQKTTHFQSKISQPVVLQKISLALCVNQIYTFHLGVSTTNFLATVGAQKSQPAMAHP